MNQGENALRAGDRAMAAGAASGRFWSKRGASRSSRAASPEATAESIAQVFMYQGWRVLGLIPARGGSKGLPRKNVRLLDGKPLTAHGTLQAFACATSSK